MVSYALQEPRDISRDNTWRYHVGFCYWQLECLNASFRYYTWVKASGQAQPPARPVDPEALRQDRDDKEEGESVGVISQAREKVPSSH